MRPPATLNRRRRAAGNRTTAPAASFGAAEEFLEFAARAARERGFVPFIANLERIHQRFLDDRGQPGLLIWVRPPGGAHAREDGGAIELHELKLPYGIDLAPVVK